MISLLKRLWQFLFGYPKFVPHAKHGHCLHRHRLYVFIEWVEYRRWGGLLLGGYRRRNGVMNVTCHFNPGMPQELFEMTLAIFGSDCDINIMPPHVLDDVNEFTDMEEFFENAEKEKDVWNYSTVIRSSDDLMGIYKWWERLQERLKEDTERFGGVLYPEEADMAQELFTQLTESTSACHLNT